MARTKIVDVAKALRFNDGKVRLGLLPAEPMKEIAKVFTYGSNKYTVKDEAGKVIVSGANNWRKGLDWSGVVDSMERHINAFKSGEDFDDESGILHLAHAATNAIFLLEYYKTHPELDDRQHQYLKHRRIGLDVDDVICNWVEPWCKHHSIPRATAWQFDRAIMHKFDKMKGENLDDFYLNLPALVNPSDIPFEPVCYITSRPVASEITEQWLDKNGFPAAPVITVGLQKSKLEALREMKVDIFVDDRYDNFIEINNAGIMCYLMDALHNQRYDVGYKRLYSLKQLK